VTVRLAQGRRAVFMAAFVLCAWPVAAMQMPLPLASATEEGFTAERLERLRVMLSIAVKGYEERARIHELAKSNGHGGRKIEIE